MILSADPPRDRRERELAALMKEQAKIELMVAAYERVRINFSEEDLEPLTESQRVATALRVHEGALKTVAWVFGVSEQFVANEVAATRRK